MQRIRDTLARLTSSKSSSASRSTSGERTTQRPQVRPSVSLSRAESKGNHTTRSLSPASLSTRTLTHQTRSLDLEGGTPRGLCYLYGDFNNDRDGVDIIFVHDTNGHRVESWTKGDTCWPRDLLAQDMPEARIFSWGWTVEPPAPGQYADLAENSTLGDILLRDLAAAAGEVGTDRPIVFIGHGVGGLIIKQAVVTSAMSRIYSNGIHAELGQTYARTIGVIFLGVPHVAAPGKTIGETFADVALLSPQPPDPALIGWARQSSDVFQKFNDEFVLFSRDMQVVCIREQLPVKNGMMLPKSSSSYKASNVLVDSIRADHFDIARFSRRSEPGYFQMLGHVSKLAQGPVLSDIEENQMQRRQEILSALYFEGMMDRENQIAIDDTIQKSCSEILSAKGRGETESPFHSWLASPEQAPVFWMSGKAGSGKSTLMKFGYHDADCRKRLEQWGAGGELVTARVFLGDSDGASRLPPSQETILRTVLYQILDQRPDLISRAFGGSFIGPWPPLVSINSAVNLTQAFWSLFNKRGDRLRLVIFIDALDNYRIQESRPVGGSKNTRRQSMHLMQESEGESNEFEAQDDNTRKWLEDCYREVCSFIELTVGRPYTRFCVSSREMPVFRETLGRFPHLRAQNGSEKAIARYCADLLAKEAPEVGDASSLCYEVASKSNGNVVWARIVMDILLSGSLRSIRPTLKALPSRLGGPTGLYMHILQRRSQAQQRGAAHIMQLMTNAYQPLSLLTLKFAMLGSQNEVATYSRKHLQYMCEKTRELVEACCPHLVECEGLALEPGQRLVFSHSAASRFAERNDILLTLKGSSMHLPKTLDIHLALFSSYVTNLQCFTALRSFVVAWPGRRPHIMPEAWVLIVNALHYASQIEQHMSNSNSNSNSPPAEIHFYHELLDELDAACQRSWVESLQKYQPLFEDAEWREVKMPALCATHWSGHEPMETGKPPKRPNFLCLAAQDNLYSYVAAKLLKFRDDSSKQLCLQQLLLVVTSPKFTGDSSCAALVKGYNGFHRDMPNPDFLHLLFEHRVAVSDETWVAAVKSGRTYFMPQGSLVMAKLVRPNNKLDSSPLARNRDRWITAVKLLLQHGADPNVPIEPASSSGSGNLRDDRSSSETKPAIALVRDMLLGEPDYAPRMAEIEALVV